MSRTLVAAVAVALIATTSCSAGERRPEAAASERQPFTYVAVGASDSVGVGAERPQLEAWTNVFYRSALPPSATFVNLGVSGSTVRQALDGQVPRAEVERPALVTVWLSVNDLVRFVPLMEYERDLGELVGRLRRGGEAQVLLANTPPIENLPVVRACMPGPPLPVRCPLPIQLPGPEPVVSLVAEFNGAIARVAKRSGAILVDLHEAGRKAKSEDRYDELVAGDGFHPSTEGHAAIAAVFVAAARSSPATRGFLARR